MGNSRGNYNLGFHKHLSFHLFHIQHDLIWNFNNVNQFILLIIYITSLTYQHRGQHVSLSCCVLLLFLLSLGNKNKFSPWTITDKIKTFLWMWHQCEGEAFYTSEVWSSHPLQIPKLFAAPCHLITLLKSGENNPFWLCLHISTWPKLF
jgi:hypothetical protein